MERGTVNDMFESIGKVDIFTSENLLFFELDTASPRKFFPIDDYPYIRMGFFDIESIPVKSERNLKRLLHILYFLG